MIIDIPRAHELRKVNNDEFLLGIHPIHRMVSTSPTEFTEGARKSSSPRSLQVDGHQNSQIPRG